MIGQYVVMFYCKVIGLDGKTYRPHKVLPKVVRVIDRFESYIEQMILKGPLDQISISYHKSDHWGASEGSPL